MISIYNQDCLSKDRVRFEPESVNLGIFDPPFGIGENKFDKHYNRNSSNVITGYCEAPSDYEAWTRNWLEEAKRVLHPQGSMYVFMGHTNLRHLLNAAHDVGLHERNHIIWKYNFGVYTTKKFVTSHYHLLYYTLGPKVKPTFNTNCRFQPDEIDERGRKLLYRDMEDVFVINREYRPGERKNQNKLPTELVRKLILYSSNPGDMVCDFFMGNFTTAYVALDLGRSVCGYEINTESYEYHMQRIMRDTRFA